MSPDMATTKEEAKRKISVAVYAATGIVERLEAEGVIIGNGHHIRQKIAAMAAELVAERWAEPEAVSAHSV